MTRQVWKYLPSITTISGDIGITIGAIMGGGTPGSAAFPAANDAILVPVYIKQSVTVKRLFVVNGGTASGNIDVGVYTLDGAKIASSGSTAQSGTGAPQFFDVTDFSLGAGGYYLAVAMDNTTGTVFRINTTVVREQAFGVAKMASAFALPATITFASVTAAFVPLIGMEIAEIL